MDAVRWRWGLCLAAAKRPLACKHRVSGWLWHRSSSAAHLWAVAHDALHHLIRDTVDFGQHQNMAPRLQQLAHRCPHQHLRLPAARNCRDDLVGRVAKQGRPLLPAQPIREHHLWHLQAVEWCSPAPEPANLSFLWPVHPYRIP